jgi:hypothetical protein
MFTTGFAVNVAVTVIFALIGNMQTVLELPAHAPAQLVNVEFAFGRAVNVIDVFALNVAPDGFC